MTQSELTAAERHRRIADDFTARLMLAARRPA
jgi:hypothetical protein